MGAQNKRQARKATVTSQLNHIYALDAFEMFLIKGLEFISTVPLGES